MPSETTTARLDELIARHQATIEMLVPRHGLPLHLFFIEEMITNAQAFQTTLKDRYKHGTVAFAVKANPCRGAIRAAQRLGLGADVASEYELRASLEEGIDPATIICNGNAKSTAYIDMALHTGALIAADNADEIRLLEQRASDTASVARVLVRFRGMPLAGLTSADQTTAADWTKFGFHIDEAEHVFSWIGKSTCLELYGMSAHIGTQIADPIGYRLLFEHVFRLAKLAAQLGFPIQCIDIGGGFPVAFLTSEQWEQFTARLLTRVRSNAATSAAESITWNDLPMGYAHVDRQPTPQPRWIGKSYWSAFPASAMLAQILEQQLGSGDTVLDRLRAIGSPRLIVEPGRSLMATAGITLATATGVKKVLGHHVVSLDMGINNHGTNLISPDIFPAAVLPRKASDRPIEAFFAGRLCFSGDMITKAKIPLNRLPIPGERCVVYHTGAYSADHFASNSCGFPRPAKVAVRPDGTVELWRPAERFADVFGSKSDRLTIPETPVGGPRSAETR